MHIHTAPTIETLLSPAAVRVLGEVRRANLQGRLYLDPKPGTWREEAIDELIGELMVDAVGGTATSLSGWILVEPDVESVVDFE
jgi:hypothetical protein